jgi:hypothetical protein
MAGMGRVQIGTVMRSLLDEGVAIDPVTGEVNCTQLAEAAAAEFDVEPTDRFFEIATEYDNTGSLHSAVCTLINSRNSDWF